MRLGITGGAGFIGSNLATRAVAGKFDVVVLDNLETGRIENIESLPIKFLQGDLRDEEAVENFVNQCDAVVHLGALGSIPRSIANPRKSFEANTVGTLNVLEKLKDSKKMMIFSSSSSVYGRNVKQPKDELDWLAPISPYAASKLSAESLVFSYQNAFGIPSTVFRFFNVFGPGQRAEHVYSAVIPRWALAAFKKEPILVFGDGRQSRDFTYIDDVCDVILEAVKIKSNSPDPINLAFGNSVTLLDLLELFRKYFGNIDVQFHQARPGDVQNSSADPTRLLSKMGKRKPISLEKALSQTFEWIRKEYGF